MDILLKANQAPSHYYMASRAYSSGLSVVYDNTIATTILQYRENYTPSSSLSMQSLPPYNDTEVATSFTTRFRRLASKEHPTDVLLTVDTHVYTTISVNTLPCASDSCNGPLGSRLSASMNNISFVTPSIDILKAYYRMIRGVYTIDFPNDPPYYFNFTADDLPIEKL
uniref:Uncharacterized protein n=1 Tax=Nelumbo nucifera TaxID=4432 RepID=A0A822XEX3_NELNU|nr:TPA_asm: hypothetical protein HUJ06_020210 [Nelumbo nucifera]